MERRDFLNASYSLAVASLMAGCTQPPTETVGFDAGFDDGYDAGKTTNGTTDLQ